MSTAETVLFRRSFASRSRSNFFRPIRPDAVMHFGITANSSIYSSFILLFLAYYVNSFAYHVAAEPKKPGAGYFLHPVLYKQFSRHTEFTLYHQAFISLCKLSFLVISIVQILYKFVQPLFLLKTKSPIFI